MVAAPAVPTRPPQRLPVQATSPSALALLTTTGSLVPVGLLARPNRPPAPMPVAVTGRTARTLDNTPAVDCPTRPPTLSTPVTGSATPSAVDTASQDSTVPLVSRPNNPPTLLLPVTEPLAQHSRKLTRA